MKSTATNTWPRPSGKAMHVVPGEVILFIWVQYQKTIIQNEIKNKANECALSPASAEKA
jgi:hypothetical protein